MTYLAIALYFLGAVLTHRVILKSIIKTKDRRELIEDFGNSGYSRFIIQGAAILYSVTWPLISLVGIVVRTCRKVRRLISKKK